jgi:hypothetical protein
MCVDYLMPPNPNGRPSCWLHPGAIQDLTIALLGKATYIYRNIYKVNGDHTFNYIYNQILYKVSIISTIKPMYQVTITQRIIVI